MEAMTKTMQIDLFGEQLPTIQQLKQLSDRVHASEQNTMNFTQQVQSNINTSTPEGALAVGIGLFILGRNAEAVEKLQNASDCKEKFIYMALALRRMRRFDQAIDNLQKSLDYGAQLPDITLEKAATYRQASDWDAAEKELKKNANFQNVSADYHYQLARLQEVQGFYLDAVDNYKIALELSPNDHKTLFHLAYRCDLSGNEDAAIDYYKEIVSTSPVQVHALINLAVLYEDRDDFEKAAQCIDKVLMFHPNHQRAIMYKKDIEDSKTMFYDEEKEKKKSRRNQVLDTPLSDFELSVRSRNCLRKMNLYTLRNLLHVTEAELLSYKNFGETSLKEINVVLDSKGLRLGMALDQKQFPAESDQQVPAPDTVLLGKSVEILQLSVRARNCLQSLNLRTVGELVQKTDAELLASKNFGVTSLNEIKNALSALGVSLRSLD